MSDKNNVKTGKAVQKSSLFSFFREVKAEIKKITWPSKDETKKALIAVLIFTLIYIVLVGGFDFIFNHLFKVILKLK
jgi:preprotein translocase subunit SecE